jgi:sulfonate transport system permease protein
VNVWRSGWSVPVAVLASWEGGSRLGVVPRNVLPAPSAVVESLSLLARDGSLWSHVFATSGRLVFGFVVGAAIATGLAVVTGRSRTARILLDPSIQSPRSIPSLAWVPLFLLWLGIQETSKVALIALGAFFPVYLNLMAGILTIDPRLTEVAVLHGYRGFRLARRVLVPAALPAYLTGLRSGLGLAWMFVVAAELMGASQGLGYLLVDGQTTGRPELVIAAIVSFAVLGQASDRGLEYLGARLQPWRPA